MKASDGFIRGYTCQPAVDTLAQVIVALDVGSQQNDNRQLAGMLDTVCSNTVGIHARCPLTPAIVRRQTFACCAVEECADTSRAPKNS